MFRNIGKTLLEILYIPALTPAKLERWVTIENRHYMDEALSGGHGAVILTAHFGNWEWMAARLVRAGYPLAAIAETQPNPGLDRLLNEHRAMVGLAPYARGNALVAAMKALKAGNVLGFLADQDAKANGVFVEFFGRPASTPKAPKNDFNLHSRHLGNRFGSYSFCRTDFYRRQYKNWRQVGCPGSGSGDFGPGNHVVHAGPCCR